MIAIDYTKEAKAQRDAIIAADPKAKAFFAATYESLKNREIPMKASGVMEIAVAFTNYKFVLDIDTDRIAKIKYVEITQVK